MIRFEKQQISRWLGIAVSVTIVVIAGFALVRILREVSLASVLTALRETDKTNVAMAALAIIGAYANLTLYDYFALRTIGRKHIPYRVAALTGFTSYTIGHSVGPVALTCAAIRYHVYSRWGLSLIDIAKVCFITGLTFWLGNIVTLGLGIAFNPEMASVVDRMSEETNILLAIGLLGGTFIYVLWVWSGKRIIGRGNWEVNLPNGPLTLVQIWIGIVDLALAGLALYFVLPPDPPIQYSALLVVFVTATLLGYASHAPGGLGAFDVTLLLALSQYDKQALIASLLIFRVVGFVVPFIFAVLMLGTREIWLRQQRA